jgi:hypothetical protein
VFFMSRMYGSPLIYVALHRGELEMESWSKQRTHISSPSRSYNFGWVVAEMQRNCVPYQLYLSWFTWTTSISCALCETGLETYIVTLGRLECLERLANTSTHATKVPHLHVIVM